MPTQQELSDFYNNGYHDDFSQSRMVGEFFAETRYQSLEKLLTAHASSLIGKPKRSLLDVGCGTGDFLRAAKRAQWDVTGTELAKTAVQTANQKTNNSVLEGDILSLDLPVDSYDLVTSYHVIEHLIDPVGMLHRCYQLLSSQGVLFVETPNIGSLGARIRGPKWSHIIPPEHIVYFSSDSLRHALQEAGFDRTIILSSSPQVIESVQDWPELARRLVRFLYDLAPKIGMGAALQAIAFKYD
ncbi:bifunctional 2-polyprenyl-6-hydroxyphenol methylase/3-demethylubiquinol 3-O-methyltransferase UbiG [Synechococcus sp. PCC 7335]|uniref:class I SAM-dependent methyltransferase n=1 Tax=Synechococcus sp. (strain ATCC 29403 / PCC 7335) TaxID=91464 RepID=UPI001D0D0908|nr:class I SAM-dependent methyltransferase [Synechococcus sp. PCC 7335]